MPDLLSDTEAMAIIMARLPKRSVKALMYVVRQSGTGRAPVAINYRIMAHSLHATAIRREVDRLVVAGLLVCHDRDDRGATLSANLDPSTWRLREAHLG